MHTRKVATILVWFVVALLIANSYIRSLWIFYVSIALVVLTLFVYFFLGRRK